MEKNHRRLGHQEGVARGIALDIQESAPLFGFDTRVTGGADPALMTGSDLVIITAGAPHRPGMSRAEPPWRRPACPDLPLWPT